MLLPAFQVPALPVQIVHDFATSVPRRVAAVIDALADSLSARLVNRGAARE
ncbi:MAG: hypothetical protein GY798_30360 [Hyphomicrobiales bacterium]|nr:hypothetical protein [Hyphomicrobiales bacterium]